MSSLNDYIRFALDIEDHNIVFKDYFYKILNGTKYKIYEAELIQPACPFCGSVSLIHNGHLKIHTLNLVWLKINIYGPFDSRLQYFILLSIPTSI